MTDYSGLVERLRELHRVHPGVRDEAADAIEALAAQIDAETKLHLENESRHMAVAMGWKNRIERLEGALVIAERQLALIAAKFARAALEAKS